MIEFNIDTLNKTYMRISLVMIVEMLLIIYSTISTIVFENVLISFMFLLLSLVGCSIILLAPSYKNVNNLIKNNSTVIYTILVITVCESLYFLIYPVSESEILSGIIPPVSEIGIPSIIIFLLLYKFCVFNCVLSFERNVEKRDKEEQERNERRKKIFRKTKEMK